MEVLSGPLTSILGELYGSSAQCAIQRSVSQFQMLAQLIGDIGGSDGAAAYELSQLAPAPLQTNGYGDTAWDASQDGGQTADSRPELPRHGLRWDLWANAYEIGCHVDKTNVAADLNYDVDGAQIGLYRLLDSGAVLGAFGGFASQWIDLTIIDRETDSKTAHMNSGQMGVFLRRGDVGDYWLLAGAAVYDSCDTARKVRGTATMARGDFDGSQAIAYLERRCTVWRRAVVLEPTAALQYTWLHQEDFREAGADGYNLSFAAANTLSLRSILAR